MPRLTGGQAVVEQLEREGVGVTFGIPGVHTLEIYDALVDSGIDHVTARHEQGVGFAADGYARTTGRVGVCLVITGPGLTNVATAVGQAYSDSSPLLVISTANATNEADRGKGHLHELKDQRGVMESIAAESFHVDRVADVPETIAAAFDYLDSHRPRPVHVQIPTDVLERAEPVELVERAAPLLPAPDTKRIEEAADRLADAEKPLLVAGGGAVDAATPRDPSSSLAAVLSMPPSRSGRSSRRRGFRPSRRRPGAASSPLPTSTASAARSGTRQSTSSSPRGIWFSQSAPNSAHRTPKVSSFPTS